MLISFCPTLFAIFISGFGQIAIMLEIIAPVLLAIFATVYGAITLTGNIDGTGKKKGRSYVTSPADSLDSERKTGMEKFGEYVEKANYLLRPIAGAYYYGKTAVSALQEEPLSEKQLKKFYEGRIEQKIAQENPLRTIANYAFGEKRINRVSNLFSLANYLRTGDTSYLAAGAGIQQSEDESTWTGGYLSQKEAKAIYGELLGGDKSIPKIREQYHLRHGGEYVNAVTAIEGGELTETVVEAKLSRGGKKHALHHEAIHGQNPELSEAEVERLVFRHYSKKPMEHPEEMAAIHKYYSELRKNKPELYEEIKKQFAAG